MRSLNILSDSEGHKVKNTPQHQRKSSSIPQRFLPCCKMHELVQVDGGEGCINATFIQLFYDLSFACVYIISVRLTLNPAEDEFLLPPGLREATI